MALSDEQIRASLGPLLAEAHGHKDNVMTWCLLPGALAGLVIGSLSYGFLDETLGLWAGPSFIIGVGIFLLVVLLFGIAGDQIVKRRMNRITERFRASFPEESGDYARAVLILKSATTKEKVEQDLLKALEAQVTFGAVPAETKAGKVAKPSAGGLLGGFGAAKAKPPSQQAKKPEPGADGVIPLKPFDSAGNNETR